MEIKKYSKINVWSYDITKEIFNYNSTNECTSFVERPEYLVDLFRGKSPKYVDSNVFILNQKCNRWNDIDISFSKTVDKNWLLGIDEYKLLQMGDIIINSTGDGTLGRASVVQKEEHVGLAVDSHILVLRLNKNLMRPYYFVRLFNSHFIQNQIRIVQSAQSTKQTELGVNNVKKIIFPKISLELQKEIEEKLKHIDKDIKMINDEVDAMKDEQEALLSKVLLV